VVRNSHPHTIDNGGGERLTFLRRLQGPHGERLEVDNTVAPGAGPPMHSHHYQTEALTVVQGRTNTPTRPSRFGDSGWDIDSQS